MKPILSLLFIFSFFQHTPTIIEITGKYRNENKFKLEIFELKNNGEYIETLKGLSGAFETTGAWELKNDTISFYPKMTRDLWHPSEFFLSDSTVFKMKFANEALHRICPNKKGQKLHFQIYYKVND
jgi:hypothetical protein